MKVRDIPLEKIFVTKNIRFEVDDNGTQLGAVREVGRALGIGAQEGQSITQTNIQVVLVDGGIKKQRQRRIAQEVEQ